jgi:hypothetical protein
MHLAKLKEREAEYERKLKYDDEPKCKNNESRVQFKHHGTNNLDLQIVGKSVGETVQ